ncbi:MAG: glycosyltransferase [Chitinivibrionales bacterium]|nr:glycosyltransferase [Chitinivibrionales bacterium]
MAKADLHVHSTFSAHPSTWFLQRLGTRESYVTPETVFERAQEQGMDFVTITDHNAIEGSLLLKEKYPDTIISGTEFTTYFPEDGTKIHVLVYGLTKTHFDEINDLRGNIYPFRDYLKKHDLAHAVAHLTFSVNRRLSPTHIDKLLLLFDYFEGRNGSRSRGENNTILGILSALTPEHTDKLIDEYSIEPYSETPWMKGVIGGSDDHSGLFIGRTYTEINSSTPDEFLRKMKRKESSPGGRSNDYQGFALMVYKVAYDFSQARGKALASSLFSSVNSLIFEQQPLGLRNTLMLERMKRSKAVKDDAVKRTLIELIEAFKKGSHLSVEEKMEILNNKITLIADHFFEELLDKLSEHIKHADIFGVVKSASSSLPGIFLSVPFFTTLHILNDSRALCDKLLDKFGTSRVRKKKRILWFTDTLTDLNGVAETLRKLGRLAFDRNLDLQLVTCVLPNANRKMLPPNILELPCIHTYTPSYFDTYTLRIPPVLASIKMIYDQDPDEIYISTPGPIGMLGLLCAKLLHLPCTNIYHTDFTRYAKQIVGDEAVCNIVEDCLRFFYSMADTVSVPTRQYISLLEKRGIPKEKMVRFKRGIDPNVFVPSENAGQILEDTCGIADGITLMYSGRISREKSVDFLGDVYERITQKHHNVNLVLAGNGPYYDEFREKMARFPRVKFVGRIPRQQLPLLYSASHCFVFPSVTDTFGMVVLEAQACSLPAIVSDFGGPQEIIVNGKTGYVATANDIDAWIAKIDGMINMINHYPDLYREMRSNARRHVLSTYDWDLVLQDIFSGNGKKNLDSCKKESYLPYSDIVALEQ